MKVKYTLLNILLITLISILSVGVKTFAADALPAVNEDSKNEPGGDPAKIKAQQEELNDIKEELSELKKQVNFLKALEISGFFDVSISNYKNKPNIFSIGDFELDIEHNYDHFQVAAALIFNEGADLRVGFIDYHLFGGRISPRGRLFQDEGLHLQIGRFDVPFGNDWRNFSAGDRMTVTTPLTTELIMEGGYNDEGARLLLNLAWVNLTAYMLGGIEEKYSYGGNSFGGRIGVTPFNNPFSFRNRNMSLLELGFSCILDMDSNGEIAEELYSGDIESRFGPLILTSEYIRRDKSAGILLYGYHITCGIDLKYFSRLPVILFSRYDNMTSEEIASINNEEGIDKNSLTRISGGININISNISYLKFEYQNYIQAYSEFIEDQYYSKNLYYAQLVIKF